MASRTSPSWMRPLRWAGWPGYSCLTRTRLLKSGVGGSSSHMRKLKPKPLALLSRGRSEVTLGAVLTGEQLLNLSGLAAGLAAGLML
ncbi:hypothetical protein EYF80_054533 [Liparis tanakae]|uniref:Uncharacterized protein n=1 Tax=Liparis tanakae TaxID=230148 RepID=A0A4Z2F269_9TELE|nr:hypothetical protein EYF80_054533 [Liparis tanakae]